MAVICLMTVLTPEDALLAVEAFLWAAARTPGVTRYMSVTDFLFYVDIPDESVATEFILRWK